MPNGPKPCIFDLGELDLGSKVADPSGSDYFCAMSKGIDPDPIVVPHGRRTTIDFLMIKCPTGYKAEIYDFRYSRAHLGPAGTWYQAKGAPHADPTKWAEGTEFEYNQHGGSGHLWIDDPASVIQDYEYVVELVLTPTTGTPIHCIVDPQIHNDQAPKR